MGPVTHLGLSRTMATMRKRDRPLGLRDLAIKVRKKDRLTTN